MASMPSLLRVNSLKITFLVDNSIEWFTPMPPGFTMELLHHLIKQKPHVDPLTGVAVPDFETFCCGAHGFSALIETQVDGAEPHTVLFDTGPDSRSIIRNIESMQTNVGAIERVVISHWHSDHSGGLLSYLNFRKNASDSAANGFAPVIVDVHPDRPIHRGFAPPPTDKVICQLPDDPTFEAIQAAGGVLEKHDTCHVVGGDTIYISGEIPRVTSYEEGILGGHRWIESTEGPKWVRENHIMDERYAAIDVLGKGLVIFSACSHAGIVNVVRDAVTTFKRPIHMVIGGLHLGGRELEYRIAPTVDFLARQLRPAPTYVLPMHCSGFAVKVALEKALGEGCVPAGVGHTVHVQGNAEADKSINPPVIG